MSLTHTSVIHSQTNERGHGSSRSKEDSDYKQDYFTVISTAASGTNLASESNITITVQNKHTLSSSHSLRKMLSISVYIQTNTANFYTSGLKLNSWRATALHSLAPTPIKHT